MCKLNSHGRGYLLNYSTEFPRPHSEPTRICCCCCCCFHINSHNQDRGHRTGSSHSGAEEYPREKHAHNPRWYTHILQLTQFMPPPETYKSEIGSQSTMCQVQAGAYVSLPTPRETKYSDCHPRKTTTYIYIYISLRICTTGISQLEKSKQRRGKKIKERK